MDIIVADYFAMLNEELARRPYVKSHHSSALMARIGRTHRSVEFKHQNISAVLDELGLPWIPGYKPKRNFQAAIFGAIDRYLSTRMEAFDQGAPVVLHVEEDAALFVPPPTFSAAPTRPRELDKLVRKFDPVERDYRNRKLGNAGEAFVLEVERKRLIDMDRADLAKRVRWISEEDGDGAGYDVLSFERSGEERLIEVKTTTGSARTPFFITRNECQTASLRADVWQLYRVHLFAQSPRIFTIKPPLDSTLRMRPEVWLASFNNY